MSTRLGPIEIHCDAPPYSIVRACEMLGFLSPLDVPWYHRGRFLRCRARQTESFGVLLWKLLFGCKDPGQKRCVCGQLFPVLEEYTFTFQTMWETDYLLGQCPCCLTIFWEEV